MSEMRKRLLVAGVVAGLSGLLLGCGAAASAGPQHIADATTKWDCVASDSGSENPGPNCPHVGGAYRYSGITNSNGYNTRVINDMWNPSGVGHPQTIDADNPGRWQVVSDQPMDNTSVLSYPDVQQILTLTDDAPAPLSGFKDIFSNFSESMPSGGDNEAAYDIWTGISKKTDYSQEIMIWVDNHRTNSPPGKIVGRPAFSGINYTVWGDGRTVYMIRDGNESSGRINILSMLVWLEAHGLMPAHSGLNQIDFGWEICSTGGKPETFAMKAYNLRLACVKHGTACWSS